MSNSELSALKNDHINRLNENFNQLMTIQGHLEKEKHCFII